MWTEHFWMSGMWIFPFIFLIVLIFVVYMLFNRRGYRLPWNEGRENHYRPGEKETPTEILKKRYAKGAISKEEFEEMKSVLSK